MSNIYISEPHTHGKVILNTTCGDIEIELWAKETPMACRNFVQLCMEGYYDHTIFHRVVKKFIIQGGDPTGVGEGGESIYGEPFKTEIHSRLRFNRRGLVAMSCSNNKVDGSQFFFTLKETPELQGNHTIIGTVVGNSIYNMLQLSEGLIDKNNDRPLYPKEVISTSIISNPFDDIVPRVKATLQENSEPKSQMSAVKDYGLLSFGDEMEDEDDDEIVPKFQGKGKSAHDHSKHSNLSSEVVKIDDIEERVPEIIELAPVIIEKPKKESDERIEQLRQQSRLIEQEIVSTLIKDRTADTGDVAPSESELVPPATVKKQAIDQLKLLSAFSARLKASTPDDWFHKPLSAGGDKDEADTKVVDPDVYNPEKYDLFDPRNPLNQRKRQADEPVFGGPGSKPKKR